MVQAHPLIVTARVSAEPTGAGNVSTLTLRLRYLLKLKLVTADCTEPADSALLARLFDGDDGLTVPSEAAHLVAGGQLSWDPARSDRPYRY